ncbi:redox-sensing transcriptional repressor Rex [bacterium]|nr:redox-sensing transcriptional repressor Rex [bacterium]
MPYSKIPNATIKRLSLYRKQLRRLISEDREVVQSQELADSLGLTSTQIRKDLSYFGKFGCRKKGYDVNLLLANLRKIMGVATDNKLCLFGCGNLGNALLGYKGFEQRGFSIEAIFDTDLNKIGKFFHGKRCYSVNQAKEVIKRKNIKIAIIAVPDETVDEILEIIILSGIKSILNFTQRHLQLPGGIMARSVDFTDKLELLSYFSHTK